MWEQWFTNWLLFAGVMALGQFSPGPDMILLTRVSLKEGRRAGWLVVLGIVTGLCLHAALAIGGMSTLLARGGLWERGLSWLAAGYLGWLGWKMLRAFSLAHSGAIHEGEEIEKGRIWYLQGLFCNLLNPKVVFFFAGVTALFLKEGQSGWWPFLLWVTIVGEGLVLWGLWVLVLQKRAIRAFYQKKSKWLDLGFGVGLWFVAGLLVWEGL